MNVSQATEYHEIFKHFYWGAFSMEQNVDVITAEIIANRNRFVKDFGILKAAKLKYGTMRWPYDLDHPEDYRTRNQNVVFVCSNYNTDPPSVLRMEEIYPIYSTACSTYVRVFQNVRQFKSALKRI